MTPSNGRTILITGGAGYIGSYLAIKAKAAGYFVHILDSADPDDPALEGLFSNQHFRYFRGSITDRMTLIESTSNVDYVIHLAGVSDGIAGKENPELTRKVNSESIAQLLEVSKSAGVQRFLFASTMGVYGNQYNIPLVENLLLRPIDPYSESKATGEKYVRQANKDEFCTVSLRIAMVYGVGLRTRQDFLANKLCLLALNDGSLSITGGAQKRPQIHIDDLSGIFLDLLYADQSKIGGEAFNVVQCNPSILEIVDSICKTLPDTKVNLLPSRAAEDSFEMDGNKLYDNTGLRPQKSLDDGIEAFIRHYQSRLPKLNKHYELGKKRRNL